MSNDQPVFTGKIVCQCVGVVLLLLVLYVAASGPVLAVVAKRRFVMVGAAPVGGFNPYPHKMMSVEGWYSPLFRLASTTHLDAPLSAYLHFCGAFDVPICGSGLAIFPAPPSRAVPSQQR